MIAGIHHISMKCGTREEFEKAKDFYLNILGFSVVRSWPEGIMIDSGAGLLEIFCNGAGIRSKGALRHIAFRTDDVDSVTEKVRNAGYRVFIEPNDIVVRSVPEFHARMAFCYGPLDEEIEFLQETDRNGCRVEIRTVAPDSADRETLERINEEAIPENERVSLADMAATGAEILGIYVENEPAGYMAIRKYRQIVYLAFLAVRGDLRSRGIGGTALRDLIRRYPDFMIVVEYEAPGIPAAPGDIKTRRKNFYLRSGFRETGWFTFYDETEFEIGCAGLPYDPEAMDDFVAWLHTIVSDHIPNPYRK